VSFRIFRAFKENRLHYKRQIGQGSKPAILMELDSPKDGRVETVEQFGVFEQTIRIPDTVDNAYLTS